jgi:uncharacterized protein (DUF1800 family)
MAGGVMIGAHVFRRAFTVTPSDDTAIVANGFRVGTTAGDVRVLTADGDDVVIPSVQIGETVFLAVTKIFASNTTAAGITGLR